MRGMVCQCQLFWRGGNIMNCALIQSVRFIIDLKPPFTDSHLISFFMCIFCTHGKQRAEVLGDPNAKAFFYYTLPLFPGGPISKQMIIPSLEPTNHLLMVLSILFLLFWSSCAISFVFFSRMVPLAQV